MSTSRRRAHHTPARPHHARSLAMPGPGLVNGAGVGALPVGRLARLAAFDDRLLRRLVRRRQPVITFVLTLLCRLLDPMVAPLWMGVLVLGGATALGERAIITLTACSMVVVVLKRAVRRARPALDVRLLVPPDQFSFPSGHTAAALALAVAWAPLLPPAVYPLIISLAVVVGYARMYLGVHYPLDVLAGASLGLVVGAACAALPPVLPV